jgi:hypothetical protein
MNASVLITLSLCLPATGAEPSKGKPIPLQPGPHLLVDDYLIEHSSDLKRTVNRPVRTLDQPVVTGPTDKNWQPYLTVLRDPDTKRFRMWYNASPSGKGSHLGYLESTDGVRWQRPHRVLDDPAPIKFGAAVIDDGPVAKDPAWRYRLMWWSSGLWLAHSADGLHWKTDQLKPVLSGTNDIVTLTRDPIRQRYLAVFGMPSTKEDGYKGSTPNAREGYRRCVGQSSSKDGVHWEPPRRIIKPDDQDEGITEFYSIGGVVARGGLLIGLLKVLRDDLPCEPGGPKRGVGYTVLAWTRDGETWQRDRQPFLDRSAVAGSWDRAMAWGDCQLLVGDELFVYYGGYARGHKVERYTERQIGLVRLPRDRYVSRDADATGGTLRTPLVTLTGKALTLNVDARNGSARVRVLDAAAKVVPGFDWADAAPITADGVAVPVGWKRAVVELKDKPVRLELSLRNARLFGFALEP